MTKKFDGNLWKWLLANVVGNLLPDKTGATAGQVPSIDAEGGVEWTNPDTGRDVPTGGVSGQVLKAGADDAYSWADIREVPAGGTSGQVLSADGLGAYAWADAASGGDLPSYEVTLNSVNFPSGGGSTEISAFGAWLSNNHSEIYNAVAGSDSYAIDVIVQISGFGPPKDGQGVGGLWYPVNTGLIWNGRDSTATPGEKMSESAIFGMATDATDTAPVKELLDVYIDKVSGNVGFTAGKDLSLYAALGTVKATFVFHKIESSNT